MRRLKALALSKRCRLVRGDSAFGNHPILAELEAIGQMVLDQTAPNGGCQAID